ncbi:hypothetical protein SAMN05444274_102426 [Mariniphaga anaerophila]|uniref:Outer membrane protein beta-barrel domain-containing protein n=1 Tax=Mariniphaga anaerophila TaxID=1484053 RepID=A0A1M4WF24_9BACT|nr:hypothetical protein [Mariniphaga anaerophila]SHE79770.1 hypothetical protein SAMN05444274_102426 [Mariniphaga anaerophila]
MKILKGLFSTFLFMICIMPANSQISSTSGLDFKNIYENEDDDTDQQEKNSIKIYAGTSLNSEGRFFSGFLGAEYEIKMHDFLGLGLNLKSGKQSLNDEELWGTSASYEPVFKGWQLFDADMTALTVAPKFYLLLDNETGLRLFAEAGMGIYFMKSEGKLIDENEKVMFSGEQKFNAQFYYNINAGVEMRLLKKLSMGVALGGENADFSNAYKRLKWNETTQKSGAPSAELQYTFYAKFHF